MDTQFQAVVEQDILPILRAILLLLLEARQEQDSTTKAELLLSRAGLSHKQIGGLLGKNEDAIRMAIKRSR